MEILAFLAVIAVTIGLATLAQYVSSREPSPDDEIERLLDIRKERAEEAKKVKKDRELELLIRDLKKELGLK